MFIKTRPVSFLALGLVLLAAACEPSLPVTVTFLHTNDSHSRLEAFTPRGEPEQGGVARRKALVDRIRDEKGRGSVFLLDAGDQFQGTVFFNAWKGSAEIMSMNALGYDAVTLGNHEFDNGPVELGRALRGEPVVVAGQSFVTEPQRSPVVATNLDVSDEPALQGLTVPSLVLVKGGQRFGLVGVTTETTPSISASGPNVRFLDYVTSVQAEVDRLEAQGINKIVLLSHSGTDVDRVMAEQLSGVDLIIAGHDHALLGDKPVIQAMGLSDHASRVVDTYPIRVVDQSGQITLIVSAMEWGRWLGRLDVTFDKAGHIQDGAWEGAPIFMRGCAYPAGAPADCSQEVASEDEALKAKVAAYRAPIDAFAKVVVGQAAMTFEQANVRKQETELGNLVTDVMLASASASEGAVVALTNGGGLRAPIDAGEVNFGELLAVLPFGNELSVVDVTGRELVEALENGLSGAAGRSTGAFPQVAGMKVTWSATPGDGVLGPNTLVRSVTVGANPIDLGATYRLATNDFLSNGGDYYTSIGVCKRTVGYCRPTGLVLLDLLVDEFRRHSPVSRQLEGRLVKLP